ncbi:MAG: hypothetical protein ACI93R_003775 [Flavobacteriales bacterium]|jgi:hypothetical protein
MKVNKYISVLLFVIALSVVLINFEPQQRIRSPRLGNPQMVLSESSFEIVIDGLWPLIENEVRFVLKSDLMSCSLKIDSVSSNVFTVSAPCELSPGAYELKAEINGKWFINPKAVFIYTEFPENYTIFHAADLPDLDNGKSEKLLTALLNDVRAEQAAILLLSGDVVYGGGAERYARFYKAIVELDIPVIICPGNHEREDWPIFVRDYPDLKHSNVFGELNIISLDSAYGCNQLTNNQLTWFEQQLQESVSGETIIQIHHPVVGDRSIERNQQRFIEILKKYNVAATVSGHAHADAFHTTDGVEWIEEELPPQPWLLTTTTYDFDFAPAANGGLSFPGYRLLKFENNKLVSVGKLYEGGRSYMSERVNLKEKLNN